MMKENRRREVDDVKFGKASHQPLSNRWDRSQVQGSERIEGEKSEQDGVKDKEHRRRSILQTS